MPRATLIRIATLAGVVGALATALALYSAYPPGTDPHPASIVFPGDDGPSRQALLDDFPGHDLPEDVTGHDGQQFYAIARQPMHLDQAAEDLGRPHYRLQRIAYPALAWALHPSGGGTGLVIATVVVGFLALVAGGVATGALSVRLGGPWWMAGAFAVLPGAFVAMRISTADNLALAAVIGAFALSLSGRHRWAIAAAVLAVLAKESSGLLLLGFALWRRDRHGAALVVAPAAAALAWAGALRLLVEDTSEGVSEFTLPFVGLWQSSERWLDGQSGLAFLSVLVAFVVGGWALARGGLRHPLGWTLALQLAFLPWLNIDVLGLNLNGTRMTMPLLLLGLVSLVSQLRVERAAAEAPVLTPPRAAPASAP